MSVVTDCTARGSEGAVCRRQSKAGATAEDCTCWRRICCCKTCVLWVLFTMFRFSNCAGVVGWNMFCRNANFNWLNFTELGTALRYHLFEWMYPCRLIEDLSNRLMQWKNLSTLVLSTTQSTPDICHRSEPNSFSVESLPLNPAGGAHDVP